MIFGDFLHTVPTLQELDAKELDTLERAMDVREFADGHQFIREGEGADSMYLVVSGEVVVTRRRPEGHGVDLLARLGAGELFGLIALIDNKPRSATCTAAGHVRVAALPRSAFMLWYQANPSMAWHFQRLIARQLVRDLRSYSQLMVQGIGGDNPAAAFATLGDVSPEYRSALQV